MDQTPKRPLPIAGSPILDQQPERRDVRHVGVDGVAQPPLKRSATNPHLAALRAPPVAPGAETRKGTLPGGLSAIPQPPPPLPTEHAPTVPAAAHQAPTQRAPTPVSVQVVDPGQHGSVAPGGSLPPPSADPGQATALALRRELAKVQAAAEAEVEERKRIELQLAVAEEANAKLRQQKDPEKFAGLTLRQAFIGLIIGITALGAPLGAYLSVMAGTAKSTAERVETKTNENTKTAASADKGSRDNDKEIAELRKELRAFKLYFIAERARNGVMIRRPEGTNETDLPTLDVEVPLRKPGEIDHGPSMIVKTPP